MTQIAQAQNGFWGAYGGQFIPEILQNNFEALVQNFNLIKKDTTFWQEYIELLASYAGRPSPITHAQNLSHYLGGAQIYLKREDLNHTGAHKINNVLGQGLLTQRMGKTRVIAETGAGQHGIATAIMAAKFKFDCTIYMGELDVNRQRPNVFWMEKLGAQVIPVKDGHKTLKDAINEAFRDWITYPESTHYVLGTACGPHPFPEMVFHFQSVIGREARQQMQTTIGQQPDQIMACVGGGSNALGIFAGFIEDPHVELIGVEAGGHGIQGDQQHASRLASSEGRVGIAHGYKSYFLQNTEGQMLDTHSIAAGLDYVGVSPILADLHEQKRVRFTTATDEEVMEAVDLFIKQEGIIPALESSHALVQAIKEAPKMKPHQNILVNLSGRGDKDLFTFAEAYGDRSWQDFIHKKAQQYDHK